MKRTRVKICCIADAAEAQWAVACGADALGFVSEMPSGPGVIAEALIAEIVAGVPPGVATFLLTSRQQAAEIVEQQRRCRCNTIQFCDRVAPEVYAELRAQMVGVRLVQVVHVAGHESIEEAHAVAATGRVDALLLDSGNQNLSIKELGGTGRTHDWSISRRIRDEVGVPVFLAGGLAAANVGAAIEAVRPFGVDVCSGVRTNGQVDEAKLAALFAAVNAAS